MTYASLFAGVGGFDLALNRLGHTCVYANEWDKYASLTYEKNFGHKPDTRDITTVDASDIPDHDILCAGFPCQAFSGAGYRKGFDDTRGTLFFEVARIIKEKRPRYFLLENVSGILTHDEGRTFKTVLSTLEKLGYECEWMVFDSWYFKTAPRKRVYIFGTDRQRKADAGERNIKTVPAYADLAEMCFGKNASPRNEKLRLDSSRIMRTFARLPDWLDCWCKFYPENKTNGKCGYGKHGL